MESVETILARAQEKIQRGVLIRSADAELETVEELLAGLPETVSAESRLRVASLRASVARDTGQHSVAINHYDNAIQHARILGAWDDLVELSLDKATVANAAAKPAHARQYLLEASKALSHVKDRNQLGRHHTQFLAREIQLLEMEGDFEGADYVGRNYLLPSSIKFDPPERVVARIATVSRINVTLHGRPTSESHKWLSRGEKLVRESDSALREVQWRVALATYLEAGGDPSAIDEAKAVKRILTIGQFGNTHAELLLTRHGLQLPSGIIKNRTPSMTYNFNGPGYNFAFGSANVNQTTNLEIGVNDRAALLRSLRQAGVTDTEIAELEIALSEDESEAKNAQNPKLPGSHVRRWYQKAIGATGDVGSKVAIGAAGGVIGRALAAYFGIA